VCRTRTIRPVTNGGDADGTRSLGKSSFLRQCHFETLFERLNAEMLDDGRPNGHTRTGPALAS
jgi:hypothetical protein